VKSKTTVRLSESAQANLAQIIRSTGCNQTAAIENALAVYVAFLSGAQEFPGQPFPASSPKRYDKDIDFVQSA